jgi:cell fate (sporulation/competence/biofilm development) regulator YlbF (YheA/YmcA/DUF963 family)
MGYFRELPDLEYQSPFQNRVSSDTYVRAKNLFRRVKLRDDLQNSFTVFNKYQIQDGARPDTVAEELYGRADLDWVVILTAGIVNIRNEWPLSDRDIYNYAEQIYGTKLNDLHHYETKEVKDSNGRLILPAGKVVDYNFTIPDPNIPTQNIIPAPVTGISNYEYEVIKNNKKRSIYILKKQYLQQYLNDMRKIMYYDKSSQYVDKTLIRTENTRVTLP